MNQEQALQVIKSVLDLAVAKGGIFQTIDQSTQATIAYQTLYTFVTSSLATKVAQKSLPDIDQGAKVKE